MQLLKLSMHTNKCWEKSMHALQVHVKLDSMPNMLQGPKLPLPL
jgi:hypothetical protein